MMKIQYTYGFFRYLGKLQNDFGHLSVSFSHPQPHELNIELHHGSRKAVATLRTVRSLINNMIIGVTKGFRYKMRYVYAHFPINVNLDKNKETGLFEVEIRYVLSKHHFVVIFLSSTNISLILYVSFLEISWEKNSSVA